MRRHPIYALEWLSSTDYLLPALDIPYCHHEKWDGSGYPQGLNGKSIPEGARIVAIADAFDSITSPRPYSSKRTPQQALEEILKLAGTQYDPTIIIAFQRAWDDGKIQEILESLHLSANDSPRR